MAEDSSMPQASNPFPPELIERIRERFPNNKGVDIFLEDTNPSNAIYWLERNAFDRLVPGIGAEYIVELLESDRADELLVQAKEIIADQALHVEARSYARKAPNPGRAGTLHSNS